MTSSPQTRHSPSRTTPSPAREGNACVRDQLADREAIARALWLAHEDEYTFDDALAGQSKDDDIACLHKSSLEYIYELADAAISALTTQPQRLDYFKGFEAGREAAALIVDLCNKEGPYEAIAAADRIRSIPTPPYKSGHVPPSAEVRKHTKTPREEAAYWAGREDAQILCNLFFSGTTTKAPPLIGSEELPKDRLDVVRNAVAAERKACALIADDIMIDMMGAALTGLPEQARLRESMANTAEKIRIQINARSANLTAKEPTP